LEALAAPFQGEQSLRRAVSNFLERFHHERNHQGKGNMLLFPTGTTASATQATAVRCYERLGGLLKVSIRVCPSKRAKVRHCREEETAEE
jgi:hypothetical protein